ncbi:hypothetical protein GCM10007862_16440 [Dyella lipolytica]|uniref:Uncharacterized protein n=1 Tax=Dyella lipolytica TaxID=1867835 RepID=A0ABW8IUT5_9GAMM|nr:hypothetical protein [Dyella lipolytica]GLQ46593.1 hypothetical protein GCM10007862_16440 [Dyella lipolytica]
MKYRTPLFVSLIGVGLLFTGTTFAQNQPMQPTNPSQSNPTTPATGTSNATVNAPQGQVTIQSTMGQAPSTASPPSFEQLSGGSKFITSEQADAYPPLANDFLYVAGHSKRITKSQYERWLKNLN